MSSSNAIFISYRRSDSEDITGRIYDRLREHFAQELIFRDLDSIPLGDNFQEVLQQSVNGCQVLIAVIGPTWLEVLKQRMQSPNVDWVRTEIAMVLERQDIPVIPLLVGRANMPEADQLPDDLKGLNPRNAATARPDPDFHHDMNRLIKRLEEIVGKPQAVAEPLVEKRVLSAFDQIKLNALENRKAVLLKKYQAASNQLNALLGEADKVTVQQQMAALEQELQQVEVKIIDLGA